MITGILIAVLLAFGAYIYKFPPTRTPSQPIPNTNKICMDYSNQQMSELSVDLIHTMVDKYKGEQLKCINNNNSCNIKEDAHSISFDLETLKKFIYHIEKNAKDIGALNSETITSKELGVRIYYAAYPEIETWKNHDDLASFLASNSIRSQYGHLHTLVMIPTRTKDNKTFDFNPLDYATYANGLYDRAGYHYNYTNTRTAALSLKSDDDGNGTGSQNHGSLIPPATSNGVEGF